MAYRVARSSLQDADAQDVAMIVMAQLLDLLVSGYPPRRPKGWVLHTAKRRTVDYMRSKDRRASGHYDSTVDQGGLGAEPAHDDDVVTGLYAEALLKEVLDIASQVLSPKQLQALEALYLYDGSATTIGEMIRAIVESAGGTTQDAETMRTHWRRAIQKVRIELDGRGRSFDGSGRP